MYIGIMLVIGLVRRHIGARSYWVHRRIGIRLVGLCSQVYWYSVLLFQVRMYIGMMLVIGLVRRHIGVRSYWVYRRIGMRLVGLYSQVY